MFLAAAPQRHCKRATDTIMTPPASLECLLACGADSADLAVFERFIANDTLQPASAMSVFATLSASLVDIPYNAYTRVSMHAAVEVRDAAYQARFSKMLKQSLDLDDIDYFDRFEQLVPPIQRYVTHPSDISARRLYEAFDFDYLISTHHAVEDTYAQMFFDTLGQLNLDIPAFHMFALFVCLTSGNPHIVQNFLFALSVTSGPVPLALLDVLGRYDIYNLPSYALIDRVQGLDAGERHSLILTHLKSMDPAFYFDKLDIIEVARHEPMRWWAALNTSTDASIVYFCRTLMAQRVCDDHLLAALDHYIWCVSQRENDSHDPATGSNTCSRALEGSLHDYLRHNIHHISASQSAASLIQHRYRALAQLNADYRYSATVPESVQAIETLLESIAGIYAAPRFDDVILKRAPDLAHESAGYSSLLRPAGHRYDLFIQAKMAAPERWFARELKRVEAHDFANWGTLCLVLETGVQFNALSVWLLKEMARKALPSSALDALISDAVSHCPVGSELLLHARRFFAHVLESEHPHWVLQALSVLLKRQSNGHALPPELKPALRALDTEAFKPLHLHYFNRLLELS